MHLPTGFIRLTTISRTMNPKVWVLIVLLWTAPTIFARGVPLQVVTGNNMRLP
jgi:hypothetical protein